MLIYAKLTVKDFVLFESFEKQAAEIMRDHHGKILIAFETLRNEDNSGEEIHILEFPSEQDFKNYRADSRHHHLKDLRAQAINHTEIISPLVTKTY